MAGISTFTTAVAAAALVAAGVVVTSTVAAPKAAAVVPCRPGDSTVVTPVAIQVCSPTGAWVLTPCPKTKPVAHAFTPTKAKCLPVS